LFAQSLARQSDAISKVTKRGQVIIPASFRKKHNIVEGSRVEMMEEDSRVILEPVPDLVTLVGTDKGKYDSSKLKKMLDETRENWRTTMQKDSKKNVKNGCVKKERDSTSPQREASACMLV
jgi:AbrB family looped-hinge helix DNA binding protein